MSLAAVFTPFSGTCPPDTWGGIQNVPNLRTNSPSNNDKCLTSCCRGQPAGGRRGPSTDRERGVVPLLTGERCEQRPIAHEPGSQIIQRDQGGGTAPSQVQHDKLNAVLTFRCYPFLPGGKAAGS
jgi:hypothetical protein